MNRRSRACERLLVTAGLAGALAATPAPVRAAVAAFPGAEGYGAVATGGRGGPAVIVTTSQRGGQARSKRRSTARGRGSSSSRSRA